MQTTHCWLSPVWRALCAVAIVSTLASPAVRAQNDGGTGTVDPNTVNASEVVRDGGGIRSSDDYIQAPFLATDTAGNYYVGAIGSAVNNVAYPQTHSVISSYTPAGVLRWRRERAVTLTSTGGTETFSPDQTPVPISSNDAYDKVELAGLSVDAAGNVIAAFNTVVINNNAPFDNDNPYYGPHSLLVAFDKDGNFRWRLLTAGKDGAVPSTVLPYSRAGVKTVTTTPDGGALLTVHNYAASDSNYEVLYVVRVNADGTERFSRIYGDAANGISTYLLLDASDAAGNLFLATVAFPYPNQTGPGGGSSLRKLGPDGSLLAQVPTSNLATDTLDNALTDAAGNLYIGGSYLRARTSASSGDGQAGQLLLAYDASLNLRWRVVGPQPVQTAEDQPYVGARLRLSPGGITLAGTAVSPALQGGSTDIKIEVARYAYADGALQWHRLYQAAPTGTARGEAVNNFAVDAADNVYLDGYRTASPRNDRILLKYSGAGDLQFIKSLPAADQTFATGAQTFGLAGDTNRPTYLSADGNTGQQIVVLSFDNPAVLPAASQHPAFFTGEVALSNGVYYLSFAASGHPFGYYSYLSDPHYVYHFDLGYEYVFDAADGKAGVYLYDFASNSFFYTSPGFPFPYLYDFTLGTVLYYYPDPNHAGHYNTDGVRYFYRFDTGQIFSK